LGKSCGNHGEIPSKSRFEWENLIELEVYSREISKLNGVEVYSLENYRARGYSIARMVSLIKGMVCAKQMIENWFRQLVTVKET
jgi:hypothetical protein